MLNVVQFSGGKDSQALFHVVKMSGVKFKTYMSLTSVDPGDVIRFVKTEYPSVIRQKPKMSIFQKAVEMGIDKILLPTTLFYVDSCGHKYYCQPQFQSKPFHDFRYRVNSVVEDKSYELANKFYKSKFRFCHQWLAQAIVYYGYDFMRQVAKWTQICHVNDLHSGNVTMFNGRPIILDYSGVKQSCCSDS